MVPSPEQPLTANASQVIEQNLRVARQVKASTANLDASEVAAAVQDPTVWSNLVHASLTTLLTQKALYDLLAPTISPERAKDLETLRTANECALESVRSIKHSDKKSRKARRRESKNAQKQAQLESQETNEHKKATVEDSDEEEAPKLSHEQTLQTAPVTSPKITIAERRLKTPKSKLSKTSQANTKTNGVNGEIYAKSTAIPTIVPSIELPPQAATPVPSKLKMESIPASTRSTNNTSRNIQPEAKALIDELFAPKLKRKSPSNGSDEHNTEVKSVKKKKNVSHEEPADEKIAPKFLAHDKRKSDVSMKNASAISTPEPEAKSRKTSLSARHQASNANEAQTPPIQEYEDVREDITAEVDAKMQQYRNHRNREEKLKKLGVNAADKRSRKSFEKDESKVQMKQESGTSSVKKRKIDGSKTEKPKFRGLLGPVERKRKSLSLDDVDPFFAEGAALKKEKKFPISHKKVRKDGWESDGDAVMD